MRPDGRYRKRRLRNETHIHCHRRPSGAGKSTIARKTAEKFGFIYVDTGAIYRTVGLAAYRRGIASKDSAAVIAMLPELHIELRHGARRSPADVS